MSELPEGWSTASVTELIAADGLFADGDWVESKDQDPNGAIRLLQLADIGDGVFIDKSNRFINEEKFGLLRCTEVLEGDVLIARMPDPLGRACLAPKLMQKSITVVDVAILRPGKSSASPVWLMYFLNSPEVRERIERESSGSTRKRIARGKLAEMELPVPPLAEQKRIAEKLEAVLEKIDTCRARLDRVPSLLTRFRQSVLAAATSGQLTKDWRNDSGVVKEWRKVRLSEIADIQGGITKDSKKQVHTDEEIPYLRVANVQRGYLDLGEMKTIRIPSSKVDSLLLEKGDILFNEGGDLDKLGRGWIWEGQIGRCSFQNHVFRARLNDKAIEPKYVSWWGNFRGLDYFLQSGKQTTNLASINKSMLSNLPLSLPSPPEQKEIVRRVEALFAFADHIEARLTQARSQVDRLTPATLAKAFRGELVPQHSNDEPATALLERLRARRNDSPKIPKSRIPGSIKRPRVPKDKSTMTRSRFDKDVKGKPYLASLLRSASHPLPAEELFKISELPLVDFYKQLAWEVEQGMIRDNPEELEAV